MEVSEGRPADMLPEKQLVFRKDMERCGFSRADVSPSEAFTSFQSSGFQILSSPCGLNVSQHARLPPSPHQKVVHAGPVPFTACRCGFEAPVLFSARKLPTLTSWLSRLEPPHAAAKCCHSVVILTWSLLGRLTRRVVIRRVKLKLWSQGRF